MIKTKEKIIRYGNILLKKDLVAGTGGNISIFLRKEGLILITPSGMNYSSLLAEDIVVMDSEGNIVEGTRKPSIEKNLHLSIYRTRKDVNAVVHTHSIYASAIAATRKSIPPILDIMAVVFGGAIKTAAYASIGTQELADNVVKKLGTSPAVLLANHGALGVGGTLEKAFEMCELTEVCAKTYILSKCVGEPIALSEEVVLKEKKDLEKRYGQK